MKFLILFFICMASFAQNPSNKARITVFKTKIAPKKGVKSKNGNRENTVLAKILENNRRLRKLLEAKSGDPIIWDGNRRVLTGKTYKGHLLNSIVSTNLSSPVLVEVEAGQGLPYKTKFSCHGVTKNRRVITICNKMITRDKEVQVTVQILNRDGTAGLLGIYDDGKEDLIAGAIMSDFAGGVFSASQEHVNTAYGAYTKTNLKNKILSGLISSGNRTSDILLDEAKSKEPVVTINAGKEILIYFMEGIDGY